MMNSIQHFKDVHEYKKYNNIWMFPKVDGIFYLPQYLEHPIKPEVYISKENLKQFNSTIDKLIKTIDDWNMAKTITDRDLIFRTNCVLFFFRLINDTFNIINDCIYYSFNKTYTSYIENKDKTVLNDILFNFTPKYNVRIYFNQELAERKLKDYFYVNFNKEY